MDSLSSTPAIGATSTTLAAGTTDKARSETQEAARKFEALLVHNMLKSMRSAAMGDSASQDQSMYYDMLDEKLAAVISEGGGLGVARQLERQLAPPASARIADAGSVKGLDATDLQRLRSLLPGKSPAADARSTPSDPRATSAFGRHTDKGIMADNSGRAGDKGSSPASSADPSNAVLIDRLRMGNALWSGVQESASTSLARVQRAFVDEMLPLARRSAAKLGTSPASILAVAAHESDWGRRVIGNDTGDSSHNLFGIKAFSNSRPGMWHQTTEYVDGERQSVRARFRAYPDKAAAMDDFARFLQTNPRYARALEHAEQPERFIKELHSAGYATDPHYASKVIGVMRQIEAIDATLQGRTAT